MVETINKKIWGRGASGRKRSPTLVKSKRVTTLWLLGLVQKMIQFTYFMEFNLRQNSLPLNDRKIEENILTDFGEWPKWSKNYHSAATIGHSGLPAEKKIHPTLTFWQRQQPIGIWKVNWGLWSFLNDAGQYYTL